MDRDRRRRRGYQCQNQGRLVIEKVRTSGNLIVVRAHICSSGQPNYSSGAYIAEFVTLTLRVHTVSHRVHIPLITIPWISIMIYITSRYSLIYLRQALIWDSDQSDNPHVYWQTDAKCIHFGNWLVWLGNWREISRRVNGNLHFMQIITLIFQNTTKK